MTRTFAALAAIVLLAGACSGQEPAAMVDDGKLYYTVVPTPQGEVPCIVYKEYKAGGLSCDWSGR